MADYIDRQVALDVILPYCSDDDGTCSKSGDDLRNLLDDIENLPSADVAPVRHGRWIARPLWKGSDGKYFSCDQCDKPVWWISDYCPNCGARMDGEQNG